jgi:hypothetical protein
MHLTQGWTWNVATIIKSINGCFGLLGNLCYNGSINQLWSDNQPTNQSMHEVNQRNSQRLKREETKLEKMRGGGKTWSYQFGRGGGTELVAAKAKKRSGEVTAVRRVLWPEVLAAKGYPHNCVNLAYLPERIAVAAALDAAPLLVVAVALSLMKWRMHCLLRNYKHIVGCYCRSQGAYFRTRFIKLFKLKIRSHPLAPPRPAWLHPTLPFYIHSIILIDIPHTILL